VSGQEETMLTLTIETTTGDEIEVVALPNDESPIEILIRNEEGRARAYVGSEEAMAIVDFIRRRVAGR
jgi:hypothetical protein